MPRIYNPPPRESAGEGQSHDAPGEFRGIVATHHPGDADSGEFKQYQRVDEVQRVGRDERGVMLRRVEIGIKDVGWKHRLFTASVEVERAILDRKDSALWVLHSAYCARSVAGAGRWPPSASALGHKDASARSVC